MKGRVAKAEDLKDIVSIFMAESKRRPYSHKFTKKKVVGAFGPALKKKEMWIAMIDEKVVGFIRGGFSSASKRIVYIDDLWITKKHQGNGAGRELLALVEKHYKKKGVDKIRLSSYTKSKAFGFYDKLNYLPSRELILLEKKL